MKPNFALTAHMFFFFAILSLQWWQRGVVLLHPSICRISPWTNKWFVASDSTHDECFSRAIKIYNLISVHIMVKYWVALLQRDIYLAIWAWGWIATVGMIQNYHNPIHKTECKSKHKGKTELLHFFCFLTLLRLWSITLIQYSSDHHLFAIAL